ncbi:MAG: hypothetical protein KH020_07800 [Clostridiales bacterium]|nr:hypothetical protein [Clostridiales bacterium]
MDKKLIALSRILIDGIQYEIGDELPSNHPYVDTWLENKSATWKSEEEVLQKAKAVLVTALPGLLGDALPSNGIEEDLVGRVPDRRFRTEGGPSKIGRKRSD